MKKDEAERLVTETFTQPYDEDRFRLFIHNIFHEYDRLNEKAFTGQYIPDAFKDGVVSYKRLAKFNDPEGMEVDVLAVKLPGRRTLENARTMQRNFIARYLNGSRGGALKDAALVAFYSDDCEDWRFSLVRMDYVLDEEKQKVQKELTPARRYSFLVGRNERTHTARRQLLPVLQSDTETTLSDLETAFNIETVTKEFFEKYKALYLNLTESLNSHLKKDAITKKEFHGKGVKTADFAKRLLGQIVFLYFLQKKGWLGVERRKEWGTGPKDFLQRLYRKENGEYENFFNDVLEPLFYEALATERTDNFYQQFDCRIPFLNGGLFEPIRGYDWVNTDILLDNSIFDEIFQIFDLYNFTVREDEPLDKEVAVDPEMLGKVFENLIPENERKGSGTYYTPREIVHYMCQESLINYLDAQLNLEMHPVQEKGQQAIFADLIETDLLTKYEDVYVARVSREDMAEFIFHGEVAKEHDATAEAKAQNGNYKGNYQHKIPESIRRYAKEIDDALGQVKICDPAIGSGAFPVGVMNEIVRARSALNAYLGEKNRSHYDFKWHAIQESIYGVDIEQSAVDIAKLRLWLSLVVDEEDFGNIQPLPNLDYKIVSGNSLLGFPFDTGERAEKLRKLTPLKEKYFNTYSPSQKLSLRNKINEIINSEYNNDQAEKSIGYTVTFDFRWSFFEVFDKNGGFDIVIANPPYGADIDSLLPVLRHKYQDAIKNYAEIYKMFMQLGLRIIRTGGVQSLITPNTFLAQPRYKDIRKVLLGKKIIKIVNLGEEVFENVTVPTCLSFTMRANSNDFYLFTDLSEGSKFRGGLSLISFRKASLSDVKSTKDLSLYLGKPLRENEVLFSEALEIRDAGIQYHRSGIGLKNKGGNDLYERLFSSDKKAFKKSIPVWYGKLIDRWIIQEETDEFFNLEYCNILKKNESVSFNRNVFEVAPKIIWRQTASCIRAVVDTEGRWFRNTIQCAYIKENFKKQLDIYYVLGVANSKYIENFYNSLVRESGRVFPQVKITPLKKLPLIIASENEQKKISDIVKKIIFKKKDHSDSDVTLLEKELNRLVFELYEGEFEEIVFAE